MKLKKYTHNPILKKNEANAWESLVVLNPAVIYNESDELFYMHYRAAGKDIAHVMYVGLATSEDGFNFKRMQDTPLIAPDPYGLDAGGIEDPRLVKMGDYFYLTYASRPFPPGQYWRDDKVDFGYKPEFGPKCLINNSTISHLAISKNLKEWKKLGPISDPRFDDRDVVIFPEKINDQFVMISRGMERCGEGYPNKNPAIYISYSDDLLFFDNYKLLIKGETWWEDAKIGASTPPIKTKDGWLLLYHGVSLKDKAYRVGALLLDFKNPSIVLRRSKDFIMEPEHEYETEGYYNGCVFPTGIVIKDETLYVYYGAADQYIAVATCPLDELLMFLKRK
ncbi:MAG: glycosidase [Erysipelotrichia bacterium]|nr:glycosidase [Erysipelotrichia bacterium]